MDETLRQLGGLLLGSIPTAIFFLLTFAAYRLILHRPLQRVLEERRDRTTGAIEKAQADVAAAEGRTAEYEQRLREARLGIYKAQQARRQKALAARNVAIVQAREQAAAMVSEARTRLKADAQAARATLEKEADRLAAEVIRSILKPAAVAPTSATGGAR